MKMTGRIWTSILIVISITLMTGFSFGWQTKSGVLYEPGFSDSSITYDGLERTFKIFMPSSYDGIKNLPVVFVLHGGGGNASSAERMSGFSGLAENEGFICVYPNGTGKLKDKLLTWNSGNCCGYALDNDIDDVGFVSSLIDHLTSKLAVDKNQIFVCGISNGGMMSFRLACELSDKIAGIGVVAGALNFSEVPTSPISVIQLHGTDDTHVPYDGGKGKDSVDTHDRTDESVEFARDFWVKRNGCSLIPDTEINGEVTIETYGGGRLRTEYKLFTIDGFGHAWPGGVAGRRGADSPNCSINATEEIWNFFKTHPKKINPLKEIDNWAYQIQDFWDEKIDIFADSQYELLIVDRNGSVKGEENNDDAGDVQKLRDGKEDRLVVCYIDVGQAESYRVYWDDDWEIGNPEWILGLDPDGWDENYCVKFWDEEWVETILSQFDELIKVGYDGAYLDWLEIYDYDLLVESAENEGLDAEEELTKFVRILTSHCRKQNPDFLFIAQNAAEMGWVDDYRNLFDGIAQEGIWFDGTGDPDTTDVVADGIVDPQWTEEYKKDLKVWQFYGLPVFHCEYAVKKADIAFGLGIKHGFVTYCSTRPLDKISSTPPDFDAYYRAVNIVHEGEFRPFYLYAPDEFSDGMSLVLMLHGGAGNALSRLAGSGFLELVKKEGFAVVFPNGQLRDVNEGKDSRTWFVSDCFGDDEMDDIDVRYISRVIDETCKRLPIDEDKIFVCGHSKGGMMSHRLACQIPGRIAGIASVAGTHIYPDCNPVSGIPILHIHGTLDPTVPFKGGHRRRQGCQYPDVWEMIREVAKRNGHTGNPVSTDISDKATSHVWEGKNRVELVVLDGHDHKWIVPEKYDFDVAEYIWCFFGDCQ